MNEHVKAGRRSGAVAASRRKSAPAAAGRTVQRDYDILQLREWAGANGVAVPSRGRDPQSVVDQYKAAGGR